MTTQNFKASYFSDLWNNQARLPCVSGFVMWSISFFSLTLLLSSCVHSESDNSTILKERIVIIESLDSNGPFVSDSVIEYYSNRLPSRIDHYYKAFGSASFRTFKYNENNMLVETQYFNDPKLSDQYATWNLYYNNDSTLQKDYYQKFKASNISSQLFDRTLHFNYKPDTIETYSIDHLNNDSRIEGETYIYRGDSLEVVGTKRLYYFNDNNDCYKIRDFGSPPIGQDIKFENFRQPLMLNNFGTNLNLYISGELTDYYIFELTSQYIKEYYYYGLRADNNLIFKYRFDGHGRLVEVKTDGSFVANMTIRYYYQ